jgi:hypothetical protein
MVWLMTMIQVSTELLKSPSLSWQRGPFEGTALEVLSPLWMRQRTWTAVKNTHISLVLNVSWNSLLLASHFSMVAPAFPSAAFVHVNLCL